MTSAKRLDRIAPPRRPSRALLRFFDIYLSVYVPLHFRALRLAWPKRFPLGARPLIVYINHPSWWDPLTSILLSRFLLRGADHYAPIDALSLTRYGILGGMGLFPVEQGTPRGAVQFLRAAQHVLGDGNSVLWLTPQGCFTDARSRPVVLRAGLESLIKRLEHVTVVPLAYEYTFWDERLPEMLAGCGEPLEFTRGRLVGAPAFVGGAAGEAEIASVLSAGLAAAQDELAVLAATRDAGRFHTVMGGEIGVGWWRGVWLHLRAAVRAEAYRSGSDRGVDEPVEGGGFAGVTGARATGSGAAITGAAITGARGDGREP